MALTEEQIRLLKARGFLQETPIPTTSPRNVVKNKRKNEKRKAQKATQSEAEKERRDLIRMYNQGVIQERELEEKLFKNFQHSLLFSTHPVNRPTVDTTEKLRQYIALRSRRYLYYLYELNPTECKAAVLLLQEKREKRKKP